MTELVSVDIGGTNARFAIATIAADGAIDLGEVVTLGTRDYASLRTAWEAFGARLGRKLPTAGAISFAGPVDGEVLKLTNSPWVVRKTLIESRLGLERYVVVNDFGAVGYAVSRLPAQYLRHIAGPDVPLPTEGVVSVVGPGTGLGVAQLLLRGGTAHVIETEGGHIEYAPMDPLEDRILSRLRSRYRRVSVERLVSGPGLANIHEALAAIEGRNLSAGDDIALWTAALEGNDALAAASLDRFCLTFGTFAGDMALAHGAHATVIGGGVGARVADHLAGSGFHGRYVGKGRFEARMNQLPIKLITHPQPGLVGAAAAFAEQYGR